MKYIIIGLLLLAACTQQAPNQTNQDLTTCNPEQRNVDACIEIYQPVCGQTETGEMTFSNSCFACQYEEVRGYIEGACENEIPEGQTACTAEQRGATICTMEYAPVCGTYDDGEQETFGNDCMACGNPSVMSYSEGECEQLPPDMPGEPAQETEFQQCETKTDVCTREYRPVCAEVDTGIRCITEPCPSSQWETFSNDCTACNKDVLKYMEGACEEHLFALCSQALNPDMLDLYLEGSGAVCVEQCPVGHSTYTTQIGVQVCMKNYTIEEIENWPQCGSPNECSGECVYASKTGANEEIQWEGETIDGFAVEGFRCVPERYADMLIHSSGRTFIDEQGNVGTVIA